MALSPDEVRSVVGGAGELRSGSDAHEHLRKYLATLPVGRLRKLAEVMGFVHERFNKKQLIEALTDPDPESPLRRRPEGWLPRKASSGELVVGSFVDEHVSPARIRLEIAFGAHIRAIAALASRECEERYHLPWRCWFDLEAGIELWAEARGHIEPHRVADEWGRDHLATHSCLAMAWTVASLCETANFRLPWPISVGTSDESGGVAAYILENRHRARIERELGEANAAMDRYRELASELLLEGLMLLQPAMTHTAIVWEEPPAPTPTGFTISDDDLDFY